MTKKSGEVTARTEKEKLKEVSEKILNKVKHRLLRQEIITTQAKPVTKQEPAETAPTMKPEELSKAYEQLNNLMEEIHAVAENFSLSNYEKFNEAKLGFQTEYKKVRESLEREKVPNDISKHTEYMRTFKLINEKSNQFDRDYKAFSDQIREQVEKLFEALADTSNKMPNLKFIENPVISLQTFIKSNKGKDALDTLRKDLSLSVATEQKELSLKQDPLLTRLHYSVVSTINAFLNWCDGLISQMTQHATDKPPRTDFFKTPSLPVEEGKKRLEVFHKQLDKMTKDMELLIEQHEKPRSGPAV